MQTRIENLVSPDLASLILSASDGRQVWLVGGAIRDFFLDDKNPDLDFAVEHGAIGTARKVADSLGVPYFVLDDERDTARVLGPDASTLDFAGLRAATIEQDLGLRDFTINACAINLNEPTRLVDPLGGLQDIKDKVLRACAADSLTQDPIRTLRGVRLAAGLKFMFENRTKEQIRAASKPLVESAAERKRDELSKMLETEALPTALRLMRRLRLLEALVPEVAVLTQDAWDQSMRTVESLIDLVISIGGSYQPNRPGNLRLAELSLRLGRYRNGIEAYLSSPLRGGHQVRQMLLLAALYSQVDQGSEAVHSRARNLRYSEIEAVRARDIVLNGDRAADFGVDLTELAMHRFYRTCGDVGVEAVLLNLAQLMASGIPQEEFETAVNIARQLLGAWFDRYDQVVSPPKILRGDELVNSLDLDPGPVIGWLLAGIAEEQVQGGVRSREDALELARTMLDAEGRDRR